MKNAGGFSPGTNKPIIIMLVYEKKHVKRLLTLAFDEEDTSDFVLPGRMRRGIC